MSEEKLTRAAVVTGGSRGIGRAVCVALAKQGCNVVVNYCHGEAAAAETAALCKELGVEAVFTALALRDQFAPPTIHYEQPDPECDLDYVPNVGREMKMEYALSNSLGFGGHNACLAFKKWEG